MTDPTPTPDVPPQQPTQAPAMQPQTQPQSPPPESFWQSKYDQQQATYGNQIAELKQKIESLTQSPPQNSAPQAQQTQQTPGLEFKSVYDMYDDNGRFKEDYRKYLFKDDVPDELIYDVLTPAAYQGQKVYDQYTNQNITEVFGNRETFDTTYKAATEHLSPQDQQALAAALGNPLLMQDGLKKLKGMAEEKGWGQAPTEQPTNEPPQVGPHASAPSDSTTPIRPGSPEAAEAMRNPLYREKSPAGDQYRENLAKRLSAGAAQLPNIDDWI